MVATKLSYVSMCMFACVSTCQQAHTIMLTSVFANLF